MDIWYNHFEMELKSIMIMRELTILEFENFTNTFNVHSIYQTVEYATVMERLGLKVLLVGMIEQDSIVAASLLIISKTNGFYYAYAPRGFLINYNNFELVKKFTSLLKKFLGKKDIIAVKLNPLIIKTIYDRNNTIRESNSYFGKIYNDLKKLGYYHLGYNHFFEAFKPRYESILHLNTPYYELFQKINKSFRTKIRSAEKNGIKIYKGNLNNLDALYLQTKEKYPRDLKFFQDVYQVFSQKNKVEFYYAKLDTTYFLTKTQELYALAEQKSASINQQVLTNIGEKNHKIVDLKILCDNEVNYYKNQIIIATNLLKNFPTGAVLATVMVIKNQDEVSLFIDGFDSSYKRFNGKHLLLWKLIEKFSKEGYKKFNLGGVTNPILEQNPYQGLNQFKANFGADTYEYIGDLELITNHTLYFMYRNSASIRNILKR